MPKVTYQVSGRDQMKTQHIVPTFSIGTDWASLVARMVKNLPAMWETWVQSLGWEDSPGEGNGYSSILAWRIPWTEEPGRLKSIGSQSQAQLINFHSLIVVHSSWAYTVSRSDHS